MRKIYVFLIIFLLIVCVKSCYSLISGFLWEKVPINLNEVEIVKCLKSNLYNDLILVGTSRSIYTSVDYGANWKSEEILRGSDEITNVASSGDIIYMLNGGVLYLRTGANKWIDLSGSNKIKGIDESYKDNKKSIFAWSGQKIFNVDGNSLNEVGGVYPWAGIDDVVFTDKAVYVLSAGKLFSSDDAMKSWERMIINLDEINTESAEGDNEGKNAGAEEELFITKLNKSFDNSVTVLTKNGFFVIGENRRDFISTRGLTSNNVTDALKVDSLMLAATSDSVFFLQDGMDSWRLLFSTSSPRGIEKIAWTFDKKRLVWIWIASGGQIYKLNTGHIDEMDSFSLSDYTGALKNEPSIKEVQDWAIEYAEVSPEKIKSWREGASWKAVMPRVSMGYSRSIDDNVEIYTSATTSYVVRGPKETDNDWGVDLVWDLGDLVWNAEQTSIDSRSKLMVELREKILEEVTRLYFERKRLIGEINNSYGSGSEMKDYGDKKLRVEEITAYIDALTGGRFSEMMGEKKFSIGDQRLIGFNGRSK